jgi:hypothetical protein
VLAVDGKTLRGSARDGHQVHLLAATDHDDGAVRAQRQVPTATNEISEFQPLLAGLDLAGAVVTADALNTQRDHTKLPHRGRRRLAVGRQGQPADSGAQLAADPDDGPHPRPWQRRVVELRTLKVAAVAGLCFPHAAQAIQVIRRVHALGSRRWRIVTAYAGTQPGA